MAGLTKKILVADDDPIIIKLLQVNLEMEGYEVVCARDGQDAVEKAQVELPDLIILDIMMPRMDGWSARAALLDFPALRDTPVIFLSARAQQADLRRGYESGVAEYITKPFDPMDLLATIERILTGAGDEPAAPDAAGGGEGPGPGEIPALGRAPDEILSEPPSPGEPSSPGGIPSASPAPSEFPAAGRVSSDPPAAGGILSDSPAPGEPPSE